MFYEDVIQSFLRYYPEFQPLVESSRAVVEAMVEKLLCIYPEYKSAEDCDLIPFLMILAHYLVVNGQAQSIGLQPSSGIVASSSIDSVSVSYQSGPYSSTFSYFFGQTKYGQEYLAYIARRSGIRYFK